MAKLIIISNRLPVTVKHEHEKLMFHKSAGGLATGLSSIMATGEETIWIGWPGTYFDDELQPSVIDKLNAKGMWPVFLSKEEVKSFYEGFCNSTIWPNFHYFNEHVRIDKRYWEAYQTVNQKFCDALREIIEPGDKIWVQDYQLMLLPQLIRNEFPESSIGFFLHIPFPSFEMLRIIPWREQILEGILGADLIGFQTYDDVGHFADCARRLLGVETIMGEIRTNDRIIAVDAFPIGIDYDKYANSPKLNATVAEIDKFKNTLASTRLILSVDRLDYSKGIKERLKSIDLFFEKYPQHREKVCLLMVMVPSRDKVLQYKNLKEEIDELVGKINGKYSVLGWNPIHYLYKPLPFKSLSALYSLSDIAMVTPLRDGMNLVCKEYIASRSDQTGVLILSERAGAARTLTDAIRVNPDNICQMADALDKALSMPIEEQKIKIARMQTLLKKYDIKHWATLFMKQLNDIKQKQSVSVKEQDTKLMYSGILTKAKESSTKLLLLDYDGTLVDFKNHPQDAVSDQELHDLFLPFFEDERYTLYIVTGRDKQIIEEWFPDTRINIIAEHGVWIRESGNWRRMIDPDTEWKQHIKPILELFVDRTPGSLLELKDYGLAWHYRNADKDLGDLRARELTSTLGYFTHNLNLQILQGSCVIEIKSSLINKGLAIKPILSASAWDFVLAIGDDQTDEDMFRVVPSDTFSIKVGDQQTEARFKIKSWKEVRQLLRAVGDTVEVQ